MHLPLSVRFLHFFLKGLFGTMREKVIDITVLAFALLFSARAGFRGEQRWELALPWIEALCVIVLWRSLSAANQLIRQIKQECAEASGVRELPVLLPSGVPATTIIPSELPSFYRLKIGGMASLLCVLSLLLAYLAFVSVKKPTSDQPSDIGKAAVVQPPLTQAATRSPETSPNSPPSPSGISSTKPRSKPAAVLSKGEQQATPPLSPNNEQSYDWSIPVKEVLPPGEADAEGMKPLLAEKDRIKRMEVKELLSYYDQKAEDLELFFMSWEPKQNDYDSEGCLSPQNDTPEAQKLCDLMNKAENERLSNYLKYREALPGARDKAFKTEFPLISVPVNLLIEKCESKKITTEPVPITADNAYGISLFFRTYADQCLGSN